MLWLSKVKRVGTWDLEGKRWKAGENHDIQEVPSLSIMFHGLPLVSGMFHEFPECSMRFHEVP